MAKVSTSVEYNGPLDLNVSVSGQIILDLSKLKVLIPAAPAKIGGGFKVGGSGKTNWKGGASANADLKNKLLHGGAKGMLGARGEGELHGGGFALYGDKVIGTDGEIFGSAGVLGKTVIEGDIGVGKDNKSVVVDATKNLAGAGKYNGGGSISVATDEDALAYVQAYGSAKKNKNVPNN